MPITYASAKQFIGVAKETTQGTAVAPTAFIPVDKFEPEDKPTWLDDMAMRGSMIDVYGKQQGVLKAEFSISGPVFADTLPWLLANILGDLSVTGTATGTGTTTLSAQALAGATSLSTVATVPLGTVIQIGTGATAEVATTGTPSGAGPFTIPLVSYTLAFTHAAAQAVTPLVAAGPFTYGFSTLNSGQGQPGSHTFTHYQGPVASTGARQYPGCCLSELTLKWNAESQLVTYDAKGTSWPSVIAGATPTATYTAVTPIASWRSLLGIAGPASGGTQVKTITDGEIVIKRKLLPIYTGQGSQNPYIIQRGSVDVGGKLNFIAADESPYLAMLNNTQPQLQWLLDNGLAGVNQNRVTLDSQLAAYTAAKYDAGKEAVMYQVDWSGIGNTTNAGGSGGYSPGKLTVINGVTGGTYQ